MPTPRPPTSIFDLDGFLLADNPLYPAGCLHGVETAAAFDFQDAAALPPSDGRSIGASAGRINTNYQRPIGLDLFPARSNDELGGNKRIKVGRDESLRRHEWIFLREPLGTTKLRYFRSAPRNLPRIEMMKLSELLFLDIHLKVDTDFPAVTGIEAPG